MRTPAAAARAPVGCCDLQVVTVTSNLALRSVVISNRRTSRDHTAASRWSRQPLTHVHVDPRDETGRRQIAVRPTEAGVGVTGGTSLFTAASVKER